MTLMLDEIKEQPDVVRRVIATQSQAVRRLAAEIERRGITFAYFAARGTSDHAAVYGKYVLEIHNNIAVALAAPSVFTVYNSGPRLGANTLVIGVSQSGAGPDVIEVVRKAREAGALTACIVNDVNSPLAQTAEHVLDISAGLERSVAATKTYTGSLALMALLSLSLSGGSDRQGNVERAADAMSDVMQLDGEMAQIADRYKNMRECITLARGYNQATAQEAALKLIETAYVGARAYSAADFQHGPVAQIENGLPCLLFGPDGATLPDMRAMAERLQARHPDLICFGSDAEFLSAAQVPVRLPGGVPEWVSPMVAIVAAQLFACRLAIACGNNPDAPRGLSKVTKTV